MFTWPFALFSAGFAAEPTQPPPSEEVVVIGDAVERARAQVVEQVENLGYTLRKERDGRTVFRNVIGYKGKVVLFDDGRLETHRTGLRGRKVDPIPGTRIRPYFLCVINPVFCVDPGSWYVSPARWRATEDTVVEETAETMSTWTDRLVDRAFAERMREIPDELDALWSEGRPLEPGGAPLATYAERRAALLAYWDSRTDTVWGDAVRELAAAFVNAVVQTSDQPFTADERRAFESTRRSAQPFPWREP